MDFQQSQAAYVAKCAERLNLDRLLSVFVVENSATQLRRELMEIYFHSVNALTTENACCGNFADALVTLQNIIEAVDVMENTDKKHLEITAI